MDVDYVSETVTERYTLICWKLGSIVLEGMIYNIASRINNRYNLIWQSVSVCRVFVSDTNLHDTKLPNTNTTRIVIRVMGMKDEYDTDQIRVTRDTTRIDTILTVTKKIYQNSKFITNIKGRNSDYQNSKKAVKHILQSDIIIQYKQKQTTLLHFYILALFKNNYNYNNKRKRKKKKEKGESLRHSCLDFFFIHNRKYWQAAQKLIKSFKESIPFNIIIISFSFPFSIPMSMPFIVIELHIQIQPPQFLSNPPRLPSWNPIPIPIPTLFHTISKFLKRPSTFNITCTNCENLRSVFERNFLCLLSFRIPPFITGIKVGIGIGIRDFHEHIIAYVIIIKWDTRPRTFVNKNVTWKRLMGSNPNSRNRRLVLLLFVVGRGYGLPEMPFDSCHNGGYIRHKLWGIRTCRNRKDMKSKRWGNRL
ncbi:hypothetical protein LXL04_038581 [Taraxacum kok-saghyz]